MKGKTTFSAPILSVLPSARRGLARAKLFFEVPALHFFLPRKCGTRPDLIFGVFFQVIPSMKTTYDVIRHSDGVLQSSSIGLHYPVRARNSMVSDRLSIKCTSKIGDAYWQSVVEETTLKRLGRMLESRSAAAALSTGELFFFALALKLARSFSRFAGERNCNEYVCGSNYLGFCVLSS